MCDARANSGSMNGEYVGHEAGYI